MNEPIDYDRFTDVFTNLLMCDLSDNKLYTTITTTTLGERISLNSKFNINHSAYHDINNNLLYIVDNEHNRLVRVYKYMISLDNNGSSYLSDIAIASITSMLDFVDGIDLYIVIHHILNTVNIKYCTLPLYNPNEDIEFYINQHMRTT